MDVPLITIFVAVKPTAPVANTVAFVMMVLNDLTEIDDPAADPDTAEILP